MGQGLAPRVKGRGGQVSGNWVGIRPKAIQVRQDAPLAAVAAPQRLLEGQEARDDGAQERRRSNGGVHGDVCAVAFFAGAARRGRRPAGLTRRRFLADAGESGSRGHPSENGSQQLLRADSRARRRRASGLTVSGGSRG